MKKIFYLINFLLISNFTLVEAAEMVSNTKSVYENPFLYFLIGLIIIFALIIIVLANVLGAVAKTNFKSTVKNNSKSKIEN